MTPEAERIHTNLLRLSWDGREHEHAANEIEAAKIIRAQAEENERLRAALAWVDEVYPGRNAASDGAIVHMTWDQWNGLRRALGLREQPIPDRCSQTVRIVKARGTHEQSRRGEQK